MLKVWLSVIDERTQESLTDRYAEASIQVGPGGRDEGYGLGKEFTTPHKRY